MEQDRSLVNREEVVHLSLQLARLLLVNGADTAQVQTTVERFAAGLGCEARLLITYEALLLTVISGGEFRTKVGLHIAAMTVDMTAIESLNQIADEGAQGQLDVTRARIRFEAMEQSASLYPRLLVAAALGLTAASLSWLFGGDDLVFLASFIAGMLEILVQQQLRRWRLQPLAITFVTALFGGSVGGLGMRLFPGSAPELCLIAPGMILVPGVPLIHGIRDAINNKMDLSLARLGWALLVVTAIAFGLFAATVVTGIEIPISGSAQLLPIPQDMLFSALATIGYVFLFNVSARAAWACIVCGLASHALRTTAMHLGLDIVAGTLIASMVAGFLAVIFARRFRAPASTFAFPGVVAMVPGSYAFRAIIASLHVMHSADASPVSLVAQTMSLIVLTILLCGAIAIGLAIPLSLGLRQLPLDMSVRGGRSMGKPSSLD
jgi:uncharacterized membrane protein YjjP (DUF1212 family)